jgi:excisionase family DNA binding protein
MPDPKDSPSVAHDLRWLTVDEAALYLRVSPGTIRTMIHNGEVKASRLGPQFRLDRQDLDQLLTRRKRVIPPYRKGGRPWVAERHARNRKRAAR